jgi:hypothetical protein
VRPEPSFYIGYRKATPADLARFNRAVAASLSLVVVLGVALIASLQGGLGMGQFEFGNVRAFEGVLYQQPAPVLRVATRSGPTYALLVGPGKFGIPEELRAIDGKKIRFEGTLIYRDHMTMIEVTEPGTVEILGEPGAGEARGAVERIGPVSVVGEIVDTKCYLGAMRPSHGKVHRACAIRCLSGGVPPAVLVRDAWGRDAVWVLASADGGKLDFDIEWTARPVAISGDLDMQETLPVLRVKAMRLITTADES